jgi:hypothetical protein
MTLLERVRRERPDPSVVWRGLNREHLLAPVAKPVPDPISAVARHGDHCLSEYGVPACGDPEGHAAAVA